jgi:phosphatidylserine decarboxylase
MIAKEGYDIVLKSVIFAAILAAGGFFLGGWLAGLLYGLGIFSILFTLYFFRDPKRTPPANSENKLISPADGKVIIIKEIDHHEFIGGPCTQLSIFLSPLNVHVNYVPVAGKLEHVKYHPGEYLVAWHEKASELNERSEFGVVHPTGTRVYFRQITGYIARRIVYNISEGETVYAGQRFGMMKFGSRMDILVPPSVKLFVKPGDRTVAGESIIGEIA